MSTDAEYFSDEEQELTDCIASNNFDAVCDLVGRRMGRPDVAAYLRGKKPPKLGTANDPKTRARHLEKAKFRGLIVYLMAKDKMTLACAYSTALEIWPPSTADVAWDPRENDDVSWEVGRGKFGALNRLAENISVQTWIIGLTSAKR
jgi:hypothetical protein